MQGSTEVDDEIRWTLLYTKPRAELWAEMNLRKQGYATLLPLVRSGGRCVPLYPRYLFAGQERGQSAGPLRSTLGVMRAVFCGEKPARVPPEVIREIRGRMDGVGVVRLEELPPRPDALYARREAERVRALARLAAAGFRVKCA